MDHQMTDHEGYKGALSLQLWGCKLGALATVIDPSGKIP
jgi:hypothetical protein